MQEIVIEGFISPNPDSFEMEPFAEYPGYMAANLPRYSGILYQPSPIPIFRGVKRAQKTRVSQRRFQFAPSWLDRRLASGYPQGLAASRFLASAGGDQYDRRRADK